jgi:hypothetical protein
LLASAADCEGEKVEDEGWEGDDGVEGKVPVGGEVESVIEVDEAGGSVWCRRTIRPRVRSGADAFWQIWYSSYSVKRRAVRKV